METKDKKYIEKLLREYKRNQARLKILELRLVSYEDKLLNGVDNSRETIQTSNISDLSNTIVAREQEMAQLKEDIGTTEALIDSLDSRKNCQYRTVVDNYYIENMTATEVMPLVGIYKPYNFFELCKRILNSLLELI